MQVARGLVGSALLGAAVACGTSSAGARADGGDHDASASGPDCVPGSFVLTGPTNVTPHGTYATSDVVVATGTLSAALPAGGGVSFSWSGDASTATPVTGSLSIPPLDGGAPVVWCVDTPSTIRLRGGLGALTLDLQLQGATPCSPVGAPADGGTLQASACLDLSDAS